jgi:hypothetical protein
MRNLVGALLAFMLLPACGGGGDAAECATADGGSTLGLVPEGDQCASCGPGYDQTGDDLCAAAYPDQPGGCAAICGGPSCERRCAGDCESIPPAGCAVGAGDCVVTGTGANDGIRICDPACAPQGGCRRCAFDDECVAELGPGASCQRHCGTCCLPGGGGPKCSCI